MFSINIKLSLIIVFLNYYNLKAQWQINGNAIADTTGQQAVWSVLADGEGGAFIIWGDNRSGDDDIYAQRVDSNGYAYWQRQGKPIIQMPSIQSGPQAVLDGEGGFVVVWHDFRNFTTDIYAQRFDINGEPLWDSSGIEIVALPNYQGEMEIVQSSDDKFIIVWHDARDFPDTSRIYAQKISREGNILWQQNGNLVTGRQGMPSLVADQEGGCIVLWPSWDSTTNMYAQRLGSNGNRLWGQDGIIASTDYAHWSDTRLSVCSDSANGVVLAWDYTYYLVDDNSYIQRLDNTGNRLWGDTGIRLVANPDKQQLIPQVKMLNNNRIICTWRDDARVFLQKLDLNGNFYFDSTGYQINNYIEGGELSLLTNNNHDIIITTNKAVSFNPDVQHLMSHKLDSSGTILWDSSGTTINAANETLQRPLMVNDTKGGAIIAWIDYRNYPYNTDHVECYAQRVYSDGHVGGDTTTQINGKFETREQKNEINIKGIFPNPFNNNIKIEFKLSKPEKLVIEIFNITGQKIYALTNRKFSVGDYTLNWNGTNSTGKEVSSGIYLICFLTGEKVYARKVLFLK